jgi:tetratricopeptide (TPR) repeat protein
VEARQFMSYLYILAGKKEKALEHLKMALSLDPLSQATLFYSAYFDYMAEDYKKALEKLNECLEHNPKNIPAHSVRCSCLLMMGRADEVINYFDTMPAGTVVTTEKEGLTGLAYAIKGDSANAAKYSTELFRQAKEPGGFIADSYGFLMDAVMGEKEKAFEWISRAMENHSSLLLMRFSDPLVNAIKND